MIQRLHQPDTADLDELLKRDTAGRKPPCHGIDKGLIALHKNILSFIRAMLNCLDQLFVAQLAEIHCSFFSMCRLVPTPGLDSM